MSRSLEISPHDDEGVVIVKIASEAERDVSVHIDGVSLIQMVAQALGKRVTLSDRTGDIDPGFDPVDVPPVPDFPPEA